MKPAPTHNVDMQNLDNYDPFIMEMPYEVSSKISNYCINILIQNKCYYDILALKVKWNLIKYEDNKTFTLFFF